MSGEWEEAREASFRRCICETEPVEALRSPLALKARQNKHLYMASSEMAMVIFSGGGCQT
jgi:hypothetical protein